MSRRDEFIQIAKTVPFDKDNDPACEFVSEDVQSVIEELCDRIDTSASPGFTWGNSGNVVNAYLLNDTVPSNKAGRLSSVTGNIVSIFVALEVAATVTVEIQRNVLNVFTTIASVNMVATRKSTFTVSVPITLNDELACYINGSCKSPVVGLVIKS
jgi:hypothetical protein